jgi:hypothetical protein
MQRWLLVGDPHVQVQNLTESRVLNDFVISEARANGCHGVLCLGDLFHGFSVLHVSVVKEWARFVSEATHELFVRLIAGNHDYAAQDGGDSALDALALGGAEIVWNQSVGPIELNDCFYLPFIRDSKKFEEFCRSIPPGRVLFCHQGFNGARFNSGFYDPNGADPACVAHLSAVVSGHVHTRQSVANVLYMGSPRQGDFGDAGIDKNVFVIEAGLEGFRIIKEIPTPCPRFHVLSAPTPAELLERLPTKPDPTGRYRLDARGGPKDIAAFWADPRVAALREACVQVVDGMQTDRGSASILGVDDGATQAERFDAYVRGKKWRTDPAVLATAAKGLLAEVGSA